MPDQTQTPWTKEESRAVRLLERNMQIANGTIWIALREEFFRAWPEYPAAFKTLESKVAARSPRAEYAALLEADSI